jgi:hypothetical protein
MSSDDRVQVRHLLDHTEGLDDARMWQVLSLRANPDAPLPGGLTNPHGTLRLRHRHCDDEGSRDGSGKIHWAVNA